jgi:hypothetical protein
LPVPAHGPGIAAGHSQIHAENVPATAPAAGCGAARLVWCRSGVVSLTSPEGDRERWSYADLVEAAEQTVRRYEELELGLDLAAAGA